MKKKLNPKRLNVNIEKLVSLQADKLQAVAGARPCNMSHIPGDGGTDVTCYGC